MTCALTSLRMQLDDGNDELMQQGEEYRPWGQGQGRPEVAKVLDVEVEAHRSDMVFFIRETVEYVGGGRGTRRRGGTSPDGRPYTAKFKFRGEAQEAVDAWRVAALAAAAAELAATALDSSEPRRMGLLRAQLETLMRGTARADRASITPELLVRLHLGRDAVCLATMARLRAEGVLLEPHMENLAHGYVYKGRRTEEALAAWWREDVEAWKRARRDKEAHEQKDAERKERLERQDELLLARAAEKAEAEGIRAPDRAAMSVAERNAKGSVAAKILDAIHAHIEERPYLRHVLTSGTGTLRLWRSSDGLSWNEWGAFEKWERKRKVARRAAMTDAFGMDPTGHWTKVRGALLQLVKDEELHLLHRADILEILVEARRREKVLVVFGHRAFLWEDGEWREREAVRRPGSGAGKGSLEWLRSEIISRNHGRIIVLPYVKADGQVIPGHTRNPPGEGDAELRKEPVVFAFEVYDRLGRDDVWDHDGQVFVRITPDCASCRTCSTSTRVAC